MKLINVLSFGILTGLLGCIVVPDGDRDGFPVCPPSFGGWPLKTMPACDPFDADASIFPGAPELCDALDNDLDGKTDEDFDLDLDGQTTCEGDCSDADPTSLLGSPELCDAIDNDCDGSVPTDELDQDTDGQLACAECDDLDPDSYVGALELCDMLDNDCDGIVPLDEVDNDSDGHLACAECNDNNAALNRDDLDTDGQSTCEGDCDDHNASILLGALELCDGLDTDCNGSVDPIEADLDQDGARACTDCDDANPARFPGNAEICDDIDNDCSGQVSLEEIDNDQDGYTECNLDCDDANSAAHPGGTDIVGNAADEDCNGLALQPDHLDADNDGYCGNATVCTNGYIPGDCDDANSARFPGNVEICDSVDNDCTGFPEADEVDLDSDGWLACEECDDADSSLEENDSDSDGQSTCEGDCDDVNPDSYVGAAEICDAVDNDCDSIVPLDEVDNDSDGWLACEECDDLAADRFPGNTEVCDSVDNDCDLALPANESDTDVDGWMPCEGDCDDTNASLNLDDADSDGDTTCSGDCDDTDPVYNSIDEDNDGWTTCGGDCNENLLYGYLATPANSTEHISNWACADLFDNDCDGQTDFADVNCSPICTPDTTAPSLVPDPGFDGPLQWFAVASDDAGGNTFGLETLGFATGQGQGLFMKNTQFGPTTAEAIAVSFYAPAGTYSVSFAARASYATVLEPVEIWIVNVAQPAIPVCAQIFNTNYAWLSYQFSTCCELPTDSIYQIILNYGEISSFVTWMIYGVGVYPAI